MAREISLPDKKRRGDDFRRQDADVGNRRAAPRNTSAFGVDENQASEVPLDSRSRQTYETVSTSGGSIADLRNLMRDSDQGKSSSVQWDSAFKLAQRLAQEGDKEAQYYLGKMYVNAPGHQKLSYAYQWFKTAAEAGYPEAQAALAKLYWNGDAAEGENLEEAVRWFTKAADQSNADGQFGLGMAFELGKGVPKRDFKKAGDNFRLAAMQGHAKARAALETLRRRGLYR